MCHSWRYFYAQQTVSKIFINKNQYFNKYSRVDEILFDDNGKAWGIRAGNEVAKADVFVGDPSYFPSNKVILE